MQPFSVTFETAYKFPTDFLKLILGKVRADGFTRPQQKIDIRYEFGFKVILKFIVQIEIIVAFFRNI